MIARDSYSACARESRPMFASCCADVTISRRGFQVNPLRKVLEANGRSAETRSASL